MNFYPLARDFEYTVKLTRRGIGLLVVVLFVLYAVGPVRADIDPQAGTSGGRFFKMDFGARPMAMGGAYTAERDIFALQWNPAAGARMESGQLAAQQTDLLLDMKAQYVGLGTRQVGPVSLSTFGAFFDKGTFQGTTETPGGAFGGFDGMFTASDWQAGMNVATDFTEDLSFGLNAKYLKSQIETFEASSYAVDVGLLYDMNSNFRWGASVENIGEDLQFVQQEDPLPLTLNSGVSSRWKVSNVIGYQVNLDLRKPRDDEWGMRVGNELSLYRRFAFRIGYNSSSDLSQGFTYGAGFRVSGIQMDYAYQPSGEFFDRRQNFSLILHF